MRTTTMVIELFYALLATFLILATVGCEGVPLEQQRHREIVSSVFTNTECLDQNASWGDSKNPIINNTKDFNDDTVVIVMTAPTREVYIFIKESDTLYAFDDNTKTCSPDLQKYEHPDNDQMKTLIEQMKLENSELMISE